MAILKQRRGKWYARVQWYNANVKKEKQVPLKTMSKVTARQRLADVTKVESDIRAGMEFTFPWLNDEQITSVRVLALSDAINEWIQDRKSNGIRPSTIRRNQYSMESFMSITGRKRPLCTVTTKVIDTYRNVCIDKGMTPNDFSL